MKIKNIIFIIFILSIMGVLLGCPPTDTGSSGDSSSGDNNNSGGGDDTPPSAITGNIVYPVINMKTGVAKDFTPTITGSTDANQTVSFSIAPDLPTGFAFDPATGKISMGSTAAAMSSKEHTITATGAGDYTGTLSTKVNIHLAAKEIDGTLTYAGNNSSKLTVGLGDTATASGTWASRTDTSQTVSYSISPTVTGITINNTGQISIAASATGAVQAETTYTISVQGTGNFAGVVTATIKITMVRKESPVMLSYNGTRNSDTGGAVLGPFIKDTGFTDVTVLTIGGLIEGTVYTYTLGSATGTKTASSTDEITISRSDLSSTNAAFGAKLTLTGGILSAANNNHEMATYKGDIHTWKDLQAMRKNLAGAYTLQKDVTFPTVGNDELLTAGFIPIGDTTTPFTGTLDGNGKKITGLLINNTNLATGAGLFGKITGATAATVVVQKLTIENPSIVAKYIVGGLAGIVEQATITEVAVVATSTAGAAVKIEATNSLASSSSSVTKYLFQGSIAGGIIGAGLGSNTNNKVTVTKSYSKIPVRGKGDSIAGLAGGFGEGKIVGYATGDLIYTGTNNANYIGGLVGFARNNIEVIGYYTGNISTTATVTLYSTAGLVGRIQSGAGVSKIYGYATGNITANTVGNVGGLIGDIANTTGTIELKGHYDGTISKGNFRVGGLLGFNGMNTDNKVTVHGYSRAKINVVGGTLSLGQVYGGSNKITIFVGFHSSKAGEGLFYDSTGTNVLSSTTHPKIADVLASGESGTAKDAAAINANTGFPGLTFGAAVGAWTYTANKWPAINLGTDMPASAQTQPIDP